MNKAMFRWLLLTAMTLTLSAPGFCAAAVESHPWTHTFDEAKENLAQGKKDKARDGFKSALAAAEKAADNQSVAEIANQLANMYLADGDYTNAAAYAKQAKDAAINVLLADPHTAPLGQQLAKNEQNASVWIGHVMKAEFAAQRGDYKTAEVEYQAAVDKANEYAPDGMPMATALGGLGRTYVALEQYDKAEPMLRKAVALCQKNWTPVTKTAALDAADALSGLSTVCEKTGRKDDATKFASASKKVRETQEVKDLDLPAAKIAG